MIPPSIVLSVFLAGADVSGQTAVAAAGAIDGQVIDSTGAVRPGVTLTITSDALMGIQSATTNQEGVFRFPVVPVGEHTLRFALDGFETITQRVYVTIGFTATVNAVLEIASVKDTVVVERPAPVVDRHSTAVTTSFTAYQLGNLPGARNMGAILNATPAVQMTRFDVGGNTELTGPYAAYGTFAYNRPTVEGINVAGMLPAGFTLDFGSFEEVSVGTGVHGAEWPAPGVQMRFITKSGGNRYRATMYGDYENRDWQSSNIDNDQISRGAQGGIALAPRDSNRMWSYRDVNADIGGYVRKDVVWWYSSVRDQNVAARLVNFPVQPYRTHLSNFTAKTTYRATGRDRVIAFGQTSRNHQPNRLTPFALAGVSLSPTPAVHLSEDSTSDQLALGWIWKGEWNSALSDTLYLEVLTGQFGVNRPETPNGAATRYEDVGTQIVRGGSRDWQENLRREQVVGSLNHFRDGWFGNHLFKIGGEISRVVSTEVWRTGYPQDVLHVLRNGEEVDVYLFEAPSRSESGVWTHTVYATDSWRMNARLTLNVGLRFDRYRVFLPEQTHPAGRFNSAPQSFLAVDTVKAWNTFAPRIGATLDVAGDGRTVAKFSYGRYWLPPGAQLGFNVNPNANQWWRQYKWSDTNDNGRWDNGEQGRLVNRRGGVSLESLDPTLALPFVHELAGWVERELGANTGLRSGVVWRTQRQNYLRQNVSQPFEGFSEPLLLIDPGADGTPGTADDGTSLPAFDLGPTFVGVEPVNVVRNVANADSSYWTWETTATKRFTGRWSFVAGFAHTWHREQAAGYLGQAVRNNIYPLTPNDLINTGPNGQHRFRIWSAKVHGTYTAPWGVRITPSLRHQSGQPFGRTFSSSLKVGTVRVLAEPIGTRRMDNITIVDVRFEKGFGVSAQRRLAGFLDLFNLFNTNAEQNLNWSSGPSFLRPLSIVSPRIARIGAKVEW